jgi:hypothetical protein
VTVVAAAPSTASARGGFRFWPGATDAFFVTALSALGLLGFRSIYGGHGYLIVGMAGVVLGVAITELASRLRQPVLAEAVIAALAFLLLGGATINNLVPSLHTITTLGHVGIYGWKELLTSQPPVGSTADLLAIPYIVGLISGVAGQSIARRTRLVAVPLVGPALVLALGILFGARHPASRAQPGSLFGALALLWAVVRFQRTRVSLSGTGQSRSRLLLGAAVLAATGLAAGFIGPHLPGSASRSRVVLSKYVTPPFQANQEPSPLAGFRQYVPYGPLHSKTLFTVSGLAPGTPIRLSTMDAYNGVAWGFGADTASMQAQGDEFLRYGSTIETTASGRPLQATVTVGAYPGPWLPAVGDLSHISFSGPNAGALTDNFRYDTGTETSVEPGGLTSGQSYTFTAYVPAAVDPSALGSASAGDTQIPVEGAPTVLASDANSWAGSGSAFSRVMALATHLKTTGFYSDGLEIPPLSLAGHSNGRLSRFLRGGGLVGSEIVGDGEQYAATLALMANSIGVPARVVLGATVGQGGVVTGADVEPWVEIDLAGYGWQPIYASAFMNPNRKAQETPPKPAPDQPSAEPVQPPVASALHAPLSAGLPGAQSTSVSHFASALHRPWRLPAWVVDTAVPVLSLVALLAAYSGLIVGLKLRRRRQRRRAATTAGRVAGAWNELIDVCRDLGVDVPAARTRREQAVAVATGDLTGLAYSGDAAVFGPGQPSDADADAYWSMTQAAAGSLMGGLGWAQRLKVRVSLRSLVLARRPA